MNREMLRLSLITGLLVGLGCLVLRAHASEPSVLFWEWSGKLQWSADQLRAGDHVHIALVDADCAGAELAHFDADAPTETRALEFTMLGPTHGHDGHLVTLTATFRDHDFRKLAADARFLDVRRRLREAAN